MSELPSGTVTFLFTDIEGSTQLLHELGDAYADALLQHRRSLREAFVNHGGAEVDTQGDAFFVAFAKASAALAAAKEGQAALDGGPVRVRMGLHTGEPLVMEEGYVGIDVHRAARIAAAGHGGQILLSKSTHDLADAGSFRDLGEHRLKDLTAPERIYQVGDEDFPRLNSLNATNLPITSNPLVGRERELAELQGLLRDSARLVTLTGAGGSGKTRLGLQVAAELLEDFPGGVFFVPLTGVSEPALVMSTITGAVGVREPNDLRDRKALLLIDNFEHLLDAAAAVSTLLAAAPNVKVLATSRAPLRVEGEREYPVEPLPSHEAVELLTQRARAVRPDFEPGEAAREICLRLDGLPLALELAAPRLRSLGPEALLQRLEHRLPVLSGGRRDAPERQRTLEATIAWSYDLLPNALQEVFASLAVFSGTFSLEAAETIVDASFADIDALVEASLLKPIGSDRLLMLTTINEYAAQRLGDSGRAEELRQRHTDYFLRLAADADGELRGAGQTAALDLLRTNYENLRSSLEFSERLESPEQMIRLAVALGRFWYLSANVTEGRTWLERARTRMHGEDIEVRAESASGLGSIGLLEGPFGEAQQLFEEALAGFRATGNDGRAAETVSDIGFAAFLSGDTRRAVEHYEEARELAIRFDNRWVYALGTINLADIALADDEFERAVELSQEASRIFHELGDAWAETRGLFNVGLAWFLAGRLDDAALPLRQALEVGYEIPDTEVVIWSLCLIAATATIQGSLHRAAILLGSVERLRERTGILLQPLERPVLDRAVETLRSGLDEIALSEAWQGGRKMELEEAVRYALSDSKVSRSR